MTATAHLHDVIVFPPPRGRPPIDTSIQAPAYDARMWMLTGPDGAWLDRHMQPYANVRTGKPKLRRRLVEAWSAYGRKYGLLSALWPCAGLWFLFLALHRWQVGDDIRLILAYWAIACGDLVLVLYMRDLAWTQEALSQARAMVGALEPKAGLLTSDLASAHLRVVADTSQFAQQMREEIERVQDRLGESRE